MIGCRQGNILANYRDNHGRLFQSGVKKHLTLLQGKGIMPRRIVEGGESQSVV